MAKASRVQNSVSTDAHLLQGRASQQLCNTLTVPAQVKEKHKIVKISVSIFSCMCGF